MSVPSLATIKRAFPETAHMIRKILTSEAAVRDNAAAIALERQSYNPQSLMRLRLEALNAVMTGYGVEYIPHGHNAKSPAFYYINMGDTYNTTIVRFSDGRYRITTWGDIVERGNYD